MDALDVELAGIGEPSKPPPPGEPIVIAIRSLMSTSERRSQLAAAPVVFRFIERKVIEVTRFSGSA